MIPTPAQFGRTLVIAPHPDDEVLGCGGTIAAVSKAGGEVHVAVVTSGQPPAFSEKQVAQVRAEAGEAHRLLDVAQTHWLGLPAAKLADIENASINKAIRDLVVQVSPDTILAPFPGDIHIDHQLVFLSTLVACRPHQPQYPRTLLAYETLSETNWNAPYITPPFVPNVYVDITLTLELKLAAMRCFASQIKEPPHERSSEALKALATLRGATVHKTAAEAFVLVRHVA
jgi:N-acetylglucosamine malate deacetylase 1